MTAGLLLDTHALLWWFFEPDKLTQAATAAIADPETEAFVSAISAMEITTKFRLGRLPGAESLATDFVGRTVREGFQHLPLSSEHGQLGGSLPFDHKDPWDRLLIAQAQIERLILVSNEKLFDQCGISRLW